MATKDIGKAISSHINDLPQNFSVCFYTDKNGMAELRTVLFKRFAQRYERGCYVSTALPFADIKRKFGRTANFDNFSFIDAVTKESSIVYTPHKNCIYLEKLGVEEINLALHGILSSYSEEKNNKAVNLLLIDSFSDLFAETHITCLEDFASIISKKLKSSNTNMVLIASAESMQENTLYLMKRFCDRVARV